VKERPQNNSRCTLYQRRVQFASKEAMTKAGVDVALVEETPLLETIAASGALSYNETRVASLSSRSAGTIWRVLKQVGERVQEGELLALVDAARVGKAKADFLQALVRWRLASATQKRLHRISDTIAGKQLLEAESELRSAQVSLLSAQQALVNLGLPVTAEDFQGDSESAIAQKIQFLGLPRELSTTLDASSTTANLLPIIAPFPGVVTQRDVVAGEVVDEAKSLFVIVDPSTMWLMLSVPQEQVQYLQLGQEVRFQPDQSGAPARGTVTWISTEVDQDTRTVRARAEVSNRDGRLRANLFGEGQIVLRQETSAVTVPNEAVQWDGSCNVVFVRDRDFFKKGSPKFFHVRTIRPGVRTSEGTEVIVGLLPGEVIATKGSGVLLAQLQKSNLGAGCCGND
jgi:cobalt-zinc-cadmium efflux system membrane fusion protein